MRITYFGHSFFLIAGDSGPRIAIDPFDDSIGYPMPSVRADLVVASHGHFDHANVAAIKGGPKVLVGPEGVGRREFAGCTVSGIPTRHYDDPADAGRGDNTVCIIEIDDLRVCHCGDLGHLLDEDSLKELGRVDVLMVPVGGFYTIDAEQAGTLVAQVAPRIAIPMHYRTTAVTSQIAARIATEDEFISGKENVRRCPGTVTLTSDTLPAEQEIWVMALAE